jgi:hypothetical protein
LKRLSQEIEEELISIPGLFDVRSNLRQGYPEVQIYYNRNYLAQHNLDIRTVANLVQNKVQGNIATRFKEEDRKIDIRVRVREEDKRNVEDLRKLVVNPQAEVPLPLEAVADRPVEISAGGPGRLTLHAPLAPERADEGSKPEVRSTHVPDGPERADEGSKPQVRSTHAPDGRVVASATRHGAALVYEW